MNKKKLDQNKQDAINKLFEKYKGMVFSIAYKYTKNRQISEDIAQETYKKIFENIHTLRKEDSVKSWIASIARNESKSYLRRGKREKDNINNSGYEIIKSKTEKEGKRDPEKILEAKEHEKELKEYESLSEIEKLKKYEPQLLKELQRSLDYIKGAYLFKKYYDLNKKELDPLFETRDSLIETKKLIEKNFSSPNEKEAKEAYKTIKERLHASQKEFLDLSNQYLTELIEEMKEEIEERISPNWFLFPYRILLDDIDKLNIEPPVLIFIVWTKAFRKNVKTDLKRVKALMLEFKEQYKNTRWGSLFDTLNEFNEETWRKKIQNHFKNTPFYDEFSSFIYNKSFIEKKLYFLHK